MLDKMEINLFYQMNKELQEQIKDPDESGDRIPHDHISCWKYR